MTTVLVTGATGFVGSHIVQALANTPVTIIAACRKPECLASTFSGKVRQGDLRDTSYVEDLTKDVDVICHAAAWSSLYGHRREGQERFLKPTLRLLDAAQRHGVRRIVFPSTHAAAEPDSGGNARHPGHAPGFWPHLGAVVAIEEQLRQRASPAFTAVILRLSIFAGRNYSLGVLPILLPRLKTHLVPWVADGRTPLPIIGGEDIGQAFRLASLDTSLGGYEAFNVLGPRSPSVRDVITFLHDDYGYPLPHFGVPFALAYPFAALMEAIDPIVPWDPLIVRSIVHLIRDFGVDNSIAIQRLKYCPNVDWRDAIREQLSEMAAHQTRPMRMRLALD